MRQTRRCYSDMKQENNPGSRKVRSTKKSEVGMEVEIEIRETGRKGDERRREVEEQETSITEGRRKTRNVKENKT